MIAELSGRARRYRGTLDFEIAPPTETAPRVATTAIVDDYVPLSAAGDEIRRAVQRPLGAREPVGYNLSFLDNYLPNATYYLPESLRQRLHVLGHSSVTGRVAGTYARRILNRLLVDLSWASSRLEGNS